VLHPQRGFHTSSTPCLLSLTFAPRFHIPNHLQSPRKTSDTRSLQHALRQLNIDTPDSVQVGSCEVSTVRDDTSSLPRSNPRIIVRSGSQSTLKVIGTQFDIMTPTLLDLPIEIFRLRSSITSSTNYPNLGTAIPYADMTSKASAELAESWKIRPGYASAMSFLLFSDSHRSKQFRSCKQRCQRQRLPLKSAKYRY
jgi:hypothetical protein